MIDLRHPFAVLAQRWARQIKAGKKIEELDLFGAVSGLADSVISNTGLPGLSTWLMVPLLYLKHTFNERDEDVILLRLGETPTWQYLFRQRVFRAPLALRSDAARVLSQSAR